MNKIQKFEKEKRNNIKKMGRDKNLRSLGLDFMVKSIKHKYSYNFNWLGRPIIQYPQDIVAMQEIIWEVKPDLIIETGIAHGGSLIFSASMMELIGKGEVLGIDIDIKEHNQKAIEKHKLFRRIKLLEGSSVDENIVREVEKIVKKHNKILVCLDSLHTHNHALKELELYSPFVSRGSYIVVFDTIIEDLPKSAIGNRPWKKGNNPKTAVKEFLREHKNFIVDKEIEDKLLITVAPGGYLKRIL